MVKEKLPTPKKSLKQLEKENKKSLNNIAKSKLTLIEIYNLMEGVKVASKMHELRVEYLKKIERSTYK